MSFYHLIVKLNLEFFQVQLKGVGLNVDQFLHVVNCVVKDNLQLVTTSTAVINHMKGNKESADTWECSALKSTKEIHQIELEASRNQTTDCILRRSLSESWIKRLYWWNSLWWSILTETVALVLLLIIPCMNSACNCNFEFVNPGYVPIDR